MISISSDYVQIVCGKINKKSDSADEQNIASEGCTKNNKTAIWKYN